MLKKDKFNLDVYFINISYHKFSPSMPTSSKRVAFHDWFVFYFFQKVASFEFLQHCFHGSNNCVKQINKFKNFWASRTDSVKAENSMPSMNFDN